MSHYRDLHPFWEAPFCVSFLKLLQQIGTNLVAENIEIYFPTGLDQKFKIKVSTVPYYL